jgi:hypothetical protein
MSQTQYSGLYLVRVFDKRKFAGLKDAILEIVGMIIGKLAGSEPAVHWAMVEDPPTIQQLAVKQYRSRQLTIWGKKSKGPARWNHVKLIETAFTPPYPRMPHARFAMACRSLCALPLRRVHVTCVLFCRIRRTFYGLLPAVAQLRAVCSFAYVKNRRNEIIRNRLVKNCFGLVMEWAGS